MIGYAIFGASRYLNVGPATRFHQRVADAVAAYLAENPDAEPAVRRHPPRSLSKIAALWHRITGFFRTR